MQNINKLVAQDIYFSTMPQKRESILGKVPMQILLFLSNPHNIIQLM